MNYQKINEAKSIPDKDHLHWYYSPGYTNVLFFTTAEARDAYAKSDILEYVDMDSGHWGEEVSEICAGVVTHISTQVDREERPTDPDQMEDEGWGDCDYRCKYALVAVKP
jgi:hypothetical protein